MYKIRGADQREYGPVTADQVRQWIAEHRLNAQSFAKFEGTDAWKTLSEFPEFAPFAAPPPGPIAPLNAPTPAPPTNSMAVTGLIVGCVSLLCCPVLGIPGIIFSALALSQIRAQPAQAGKNMATAGLALSIFSFIVYGLLFAFGAFANLLQQITK